MRRRHRWIGFLFVVLTTASATFSFIQSERFASIARDVALRVLPADSGIELQFQAIRIQLFPPAIAIQQPTVTITGSRLIDLPPGTRVRASRIDLRFRLIQLLSGALRVHEVAVVDSELHVPLTAAYLESKKRASARRRSSPLRITWEDLFRVRADAIILERAKLTVSSESPRLSAGMNVDHFEVGQWFGRAGLGYRGELVVRDVRGEFPKAWGLPESWGQIALRIQANPEGLRIRSASLVNAWATLTASGALDGNLFEPDTLKVQADAKVRVDLEELKNAFPAVAAAKIKSGVVEGRVRAQADFARIAETLSAEGDVSGNRLDVAGIKADQVQFVGKWEPGSVLAVKRLELSSEPRDRVIAAPGRMGAPGGGGTLKVGSFRWPFGGTAKGAESAVSVPLEFENFHLHSALPPGDGGLFGLHFRLNGKAGVTYDPTTPGLRVHVAGLALRNFKYDNQRRLKVRPLRRIIDIPEIKLSGDVAVNLPTGSTRIETLALKLPHTELIANGEIGSGKTKGGTEIDIDVDGSVDLADIGIIADNAIAGKGTLSVRIEGGASNLKVSFEPEVEGASYLGLDLGRLTGGSIVLDDAKDMLWFNELGAVQGQTRYRADGSIGIGPGENLIELGVDIQPGARVADVRKILTKQLKQLDWYQRWLGTLDGAVEGSVAISGGLAMDRMKIWAEVQGKNWELWGENFRTFRGEGGWDRGAYRLLNARATKGATASVAGQIEMEPTGELTWRLESEKLTLLDIDHLAGLDVPVRGSLEISSKGKGPPGSIQSLSIFQLTDLRVRGMPTSPALATLRSQNGSIHIQGSAFGNQVAWDWMSGGTATATPSGGQSIAPNFLQLELRDTDFTPLVQILNPELMRDPHLRAKVSGAIDIRYPEGSLDKASGRASITSAEFSREGIRVALKQPTGTTLKEGTFDWGPAVVVDGENELEATLKGVGGALDGRVRGKIGLHLLDSLISSVEEAEGAVDLDLGIGGTLDVPTLFGRARVFGGLVRVSSLESPIENLSGQVGLKSSVLTFSQFEGDLGGGRASGSGTIGLYSTKFPSLDLAFGLQATRLKIYPFQMLKLSGRVSVVGESVPYTIRGEVMSDSGVIRERFGGGGGGATGASKAVAGTHRFAPPTIRKTEAGASAFLLDVSARAEKGLMIQNGLIEGEAKGQIQIVNTLDAPRLLGSAELISGKLQFKDRQFVITSSEVEFDSPAVINPKISMTAISELNSVKIQLLTSGRIDQLKFELSSNPVLPETEILSLLATGVTSDDVRKWRAGDRRAIQQGGAAALVLQSLDFNQEVQSKTGFEIKIDEAIDRELGQSIFRRPDADVAGSPKIVIKRQIGKKFDVSVGSTVGVGTNSQRQFNAEYHVTPGFSVLGVWDSLQGAEAQERTSFGLDLKLQRRFR